MINDILDFSKIESGKLELQVERTDLIELVNQVTDLFKIQSDQKRLLLKTTIAPTVPQFISADPARLRQVLVNLLGNAVKFTDRGEIELMIENKDKKSLRFAVRDTGIGIDLQNQKKIFDAFTQEDSSTTKRFGGTGLGLTISNQLLALMQCALNVTSKPGEGSMFHFDFPIKTSDKHDVPNG